MDATKNNSPQDEPQSSAGGQNVGCLLHVFWLMVGNMALALCAAGIMERRAAWFSGLDAVYWGLVLALLAARFVDIRFLKGTTVSGQPATMRHLLRYAVILPAVALGLWLLAHFLGRFAG